MSDNEKFQPSVTGICPLCKKTNLTQTLEEKPCLRPVVQEWRAASYTRLSKNSLPNLWALPYRAQQAGVPPPFCLRKTRPYQPISKITY